MSNLCDNELIKFAVVSFRVVKMSLSEYSCEDKIKKQNKNWRKSYTKNQIPIDTTKQVILSHRVSKRPRHDFKDVITIN